MSVLFPQKTGGTISVSDSDSLAAMDPDGLPLGTRVWNIDVGSFFTLKDSTASLVTDEVVAVLGITGYRWIVDAAAFTGVTTDATLSGDGTADDPLEVVSAPLASALPNVGPATAGIGGASTLTLSGLTGDTDGDYIIDGILLMSGVQTVKALLNGADFQTCKAFNVAAVTGVAGPTFTNETTAVMIVTGGGTHTMSVQGRIAVKHGRICSFSIELGGDDGTHTVWSYTRGYHTPAAQVTSFGVTTSAVNGLLQNSYIRALKTGLTV